jgi:hypothetical protein
MLEIRQTKKPAEDNQGACCQTRSILNGTSETAIHGLMTSRSEFLFASMFDVGRSMFNVPPSPQPLQRTDHPTALNLDGGHPLHRSMIVRSD